MKIFVVNGSARKNGNTAQLCKAFKEGVLSQSAEIEVKEINVYDYTFSGCKGCLTCKMSKAGIILCPLSAVSEYSTRRG